MKLLLLFLPLLTLASSNYERLRSIETLNNFAFGSCNDQNREQVLWPRIAAASPQVFIWGGDNIYADAQNAKELEEAYATLRNIDGYKKLISATAVIGTWDDHDYGTNDADFTNPIKKASRRFFMDFLGEPKNSDRRTREGGIYTSYSFGHDRSKSRIILLDTRFHLNSPEKNSDILGAAQWTWLEDELQKSDAKIHFIVSGFSVMSDDVPKAWEWADFPKAHIRLLELLKKTRPSGVVFLSGDKHFSSIYKNYGHLEFINSGMTHTAPWYLQWAASLFYPNIFFGRTFGQVKIVWREHRGPLLKLKAINEKGIPKIFKEYELMEDGSWAEKGLNL